MRVVFGVAAGVLALAILIGFGFPSLALPAAGAEQAAEAAVVQATKAPIQLAGGAALKPRPKPR